MVFILHMSDVDCVEKNIILIAAAEYGGLAVEFHPACKLTLCDKAPAYLEFHPDQHHQEPFLEIQETQTDVDNTVVIGANNIARFFSQFHMIGTGRSSNYVDVPNKVALAKVFTEQYIGFSTIHFYRRASMYYKYHGPIAKPPFSVQLKEMTLICLGNVLNVFNHRLAKTGNYLLGHSLTLADIIVTCHLHFAFTHLLSKSFTLEYGHVEKYFWNMVERPSFKKILVKVKQLVED